jgi:hypothetical protein
MNKTTMVYAIRRVNGSVNGNPTLELITQDGDFKTQSDNAIGYSIQNLRLKHGDFVNMELTKAYRVTSIKKVEV